MPTVAAPRSHVEDPRRWTGLPRRFPRAFLALAAVVWFLGYRALDPLSVWLVGLLPLAAGSRLHDAVQFFLYDTPEGAPAPDRGGDGHGDDQLLLHAGAHARPARGPGARAWATCWRPAWASSRPFCSCSAVPLFIGFVQAGVPLGVTFSFLISAPMVNEVALALLFGLFGWKVAALYLGIGLSIAIVAGLRHRPAQAGALPRGLGARDAAASTRPSSETR